MEKTPYVYSKNLAQEIFRAYDIRGVVAKNLDENVVYTIARAIGSEIRASKQNSVVVGRDGRLSSPSLARALITGLTASGCDVIDIGLVPTPVLYFATHTLTTQSGVMLTGSHNPGDCNGLKMVIAGSTLTEERIQQLYQRIQKMDLSEGQGTLSHYDNILTDYVHYVANNIKLARPLRIAIDCGNGAAGVVAPALFRALGCEVTELFCSVDGHFPHHHPDPSVPENLTDLIQCIKKNKLDVGLAFDGDADRIGVVTNQGDIINPDRQMIYFAADVLKRYPGAPIVFDVKSTHHLSHAIAACGGKPVMWKTGHSVLKAKMLELKAPLAGEFSGHIFFNEGWFGFDDGMYVGARMLQQLSRQAENAHEVFQKIPNSIATPEIKIAISEAEKFNFMQAFTTSASFPGATLHKIDGIRAEFSHGWGLLRASNTTPYLIARFEADDELALRDIQQRFRAEILRIDNRLTIIF